MSAGNMNAMSLHIAKALAAVAVCERITDLANDAQTARDEARIRYDRAVELANATFTSATIAAMSEYGRQINAIDDSDDDDDDDDDI